MEHIYKEHSKRKTVSLNGEWKFCVDGDNKGEVEQWYKNFPDNFRYIIVPGCWNLELDLYGYFGSAWYSKEFECSECYLQIEFGAVTGFAKVYLDGTELGSHYGGWTAFDFGCMVSSGKHILTVFVDASSNNINTIPLQRADWYHYGGIIRSVEITEFTKPYIHRYKVSYELDSSLDSATLNAEVELSNPFGGEYSTLVEVQVEGKTMGTTEAVIGENGKVFLKDISLEHVRLWDVGKPEIYEIRIVSADDDAFVRMGLRKIEARNQQFYLNGRPLFLKGVNRHEDHPDWGFAVPANIMKRDIQIIKDLNCNSIRGSHYPNSQTFLDYLDREGILFWSEIPMWGFPANALGDKLTLERGLKMHEEMIDQYYHHPSIIIWGLHNEVATNSQECYNLTNNFFELIRTLDNSRLITYATDKFDRDICLEFTDFVSLNYYLGWYNHSIADWDDFIHGLRATMIEKGAGDKPIVLSEFGCAALYGCSSFNNNKWTMQYQSDFLERVIRLCYEENGVCGTLLWQFTDIASEMDINRARSFNNKGILDEYRRPKLSYYTVRSLYAKID